MGREEIIKKIVNILYKADEWCEYDEKYEQVANEIINAIVPEGAVVLTKEQYNEMRSKSNVVAYIDITKDIRKEFESELKQVRKEMAKEILQKFDKRLTEKFLKSADDQEIIQTARILRNVCPVKVHRVKKRT